MGLENIVDSLIIDTIIKWVNCFFLIELSIRIPGTNIKSIYFSFFYKQKLHNIYLRIFQKSNEYY